MITIATKSGHLSPKKPSRRSYLCRTPPRLSVGLGPWEDKNIEVSKFRPGMCAFEASSGGLRMSQSDRFSKGVCPEQLGRMRASIFPISTTERCTRKGSTFSTGQMPLRLKDTLIYREKDEKRLAGADWHDFNECLSLIAARSAPPASKQRQDVKLTKEANFLTQKKHTNTSHT